MRTLLLNNLNWLLLEKLLRISGTLLISIWMARYLGPAQFGLLSLAIAFVALFSAVARLGMDQVIVRDLTRHPEQAGTVLGTVFRLKLYAGGVAMVGAILTAWTTDGSHLQYLALVAIIASGLIFNAFDTYDLHYQARLMSRYPAVARSTTFILFLLLRTGLILSGAPLEYFAIATTLEVMLAGLLMAAQYRRLPQLRVTWSFDRDTSLHLWRDGWPLVITTALIVIHTRIDQVMLGHMLDNAAVGIYSAAQRLSESWLFIPAVIVQIMTPYMVRLRQDNPERYQSRLMQLYSLMFWLGVLAGVVIILFGRSLVLFIFGEQYQASYQPLVLSIWTGIFISQAVARSIWMVSENRQRYQLFNNLMAVPLNILLNWLWIPTYGATGAAMASLVSIGVSTWLLPFAFQPMRASNWQMLCAIYPTYLWRAGK